MTGCTKCLNISNYFLVSVLFRVKISVPAL